MTFLELKNRERAGTNLSMGLGFLGCEHLDVDRVAEPGSRQPPRPHSGPPAARSWMSTAELVLRAPMSQRNTSLSAARFQSRDEVRTRLEAWHPVAQTALGGIHSDSAFLDPSGIQSFACRHVAPHSCPQPRRVPPAPTFVGQLSY